MNGTAVKRTGRKKRLILLAALAALVLLLVFALDSRLAVRTYTLETGEVTAPVRLAVVTDLHSCAYGEEQEELVSAVLNLDPQPDGVLLVGDIVDDVAAGGKRLDRCVASGGVLLLLLCHRQPRVVER